MYASISGIGTHKGAHSDNSPVFIPPRLHQRATDQSSRVAHSAPGYLIHARYVQNPSGSGNEDLLLN
ncbi:MAG: hypothetical protein C0607_07880 [Azoarcus sp.]|nr:MAG: hypothetical protein C0607_07880 [Azoarcus sp.]